MLNFTRSSGLAQVLVCFSGVWGSICADHWDSYDGEVTCRQLGLPTQGITMTQFIIVHNFYSGFWKYSYHRRNYTISKQCFDCTIMVD